MSLNINRKQLVALLLIGGIIALTLYVNFNLPEIKRELDQYPVETFEPEAPLNEDLIVEDSGGLESGIVTNLEFSPDGSRALQLSVNGLFLLDNQGNILKEIDKDVSNAKFNSDNQIYYQKISGEFGIYSYLIKEDSKRVFASSTDSQYFENIAFVNEDKYFFAEPKTGKFGYGNIESGDINYLGQKVIDKAGILENDSAAYIGAFTSEDKKSLGVIERALNEGVEEDYLKIFPSNETKFITPVFQAKIESGYNNNYEVKLDGHYLTAGNDALTIDLNTKKIIYRGPENKVTLTRFSPGKTRQIACTGDLQSKACDPLPSDIDQIEWIDNNNLILVIGESLYSYDFEIKELSRVGEQRGNYKLLTRNSLNNSLIIMLNGQIKEVKFKS